MDVHNAFLHCNLVVEVYIQLLPGFNSTISGNVCRLSKSLYGLRPTPRNWFAKLSTTLKEIGFQQSYVDYSLFSYLKGDVSIHVLIYVDDLIITGSSSLAIRKFKEQLGERFHMKNLGILKYFLGIEVAHGKDSLFLSQRKYVLDIISETGLLGACLVSTPMEQNHHLATINGVVSDDLEKYRWIVGCLIYLTIMRPKLCYSVLLLAQFMGEPCVEHWDATLRVLWSLKGCPGQGILLCEESNFQLYAFCDSDWASCPLTRKSLTSYFVLLGSSPVSWKTKK
uniref:Copia protein n=1 Tax=Cajanus cajan TaxID=3821 RepID=A0A151T0A8_CAJCA|nr:Copia protein [Cajanus cajan]KYP68076.1 Copia protein [Cajanus cajan]